MSILKREKCDFCGKISDEEGVMWELFDSHCCHKCKEVVITVLEETANYTMPSGKVPQDKKEFSVMMYNLSLKAESNL